MRETTPPGIGLAVVAALLFGLATPAAHQLLSGTSPLMLSALLYLGSGGGLAVLGLPSWRHTALPRLQRQEWLPLAGAVLLGGMIAPVCLLAGLREIGATRASLLLNLEGVFTALLAWRLFGEAADGAVMAGMGCVMAACLLLAWPEAGDALPGALAGLPLPGAGLVALACLCWGLDNNLTRSVSHLDARGIALCKGLAAGSCNLLVARLYGHPWPPLDVALPALLTGFLGYGLSLVAYVRAQSLLGAARTAAWFGLAPFAGALAALLLLHEPAPRLLWPGAALLALGLWLHLRERHSHAHQHPVQQHSHRHRHDSHHQHRHDFAWDGQEPHAHPHQHTALVHAHAHFPDLHHRHTHPPGETVHTATPGHPAAAQTPLPAAGSLPTAQLLAAYRATAYRVDASETFVLKVDCHSPALAALLDATGCRCAAFLTACNPYSQPLSSEDNAARQRALRAELLAAGYHALEGAGVPAGADWQAEPSVLVPGLERAAALALAQRWQQHAIVWSDRDAIPRLLLTGLPS